MTYLGLCALEFENVLKIVIEHLLGWNKSGKNKGNVKDVALFGDLDAYLVVVEQQGRAAQNGTQDPTECPEIELRDSPRLRVLQNFTRHESRFSDGYDSDGEKGPFLDAIWAKGDQHREESEQSFHFGPDAAAATAAAEEDEENSSSDEEEDSSSAEEQEQEEEGDDDENLQTKSVVWLRQELKLRRQPTSGNKAVLVSRLTKAIDQDIKRFDTMEEARNASRP
eukprot:jgi/Psemu1/31577/gm1.31577_g